ncbi:hypothetical protein MDV086.4 [Gallid alphaherpesvirus 2]|nr:hypothetical protein MDV086.4 [Gallid alphaherpesvirus 2]
MHGENTQLFSYPLNRTLFPLSAPRTPRPRGAPICAEEGTVPFFFGGGGTHLRRERHGSSFFFPTTSRLHMQALRTSLYLKAP